MAFIDPDSDRGPGRDAVELYTRTYGTLQRSSGETKLKVLEQSHIGMQSSLHPKAGSAEPDTGALIYALRRLPPSITAVRRAVLEARRRIQTDEKDFRVRMLGGTQIGYIKATRRWWEPIESLMQREGVHDRPVYFVSSNTHSLVNLLSGSARRHQGEIVEYIERSNNLELVPELRKLRQGQSRGNWDNFLYYAARSYYGQSAEAGERRAQRTSEEEARGIFFLPSHAGLDVAAQVILLEPLVRSGPDARP